MINVIIWICSIFIIIKELGYDLTGVVAGLGIGSVIISLAAQDTVKSLLSKNGVWAKIKNTKKEGK